MHARSNRHSCALDSIAQSRCQGMAFRATTDRPASTLATTLATFVSLWVSGYAQTNVSRKSRRHGYRANQVLLHPKSGLVGNIGLKHLKVIKEDTINKWDKLGFLEGLKGHLKENVAQLYENQASFLINEASSDGTSNGAFETVVFPIVRRVFSKLLANDIVSVQAIDDEFLEWFVKNPSCENVKVELIEEIPSGFTFRFTL